MKYTIYTKKNRNGIVISEDTFKTVSSYKKNKINAWIETSDWSGNTEDITELAKGETSESKEKRDQKNRDTEKEENEKYYENQNKIFNDNKRRLKSLSLEEKANNLKIASFLLSCYGSKLTDEMKPFIIDFQRKYFTENPSLESSQHAKAR